MRSISLQEVDSFIVETDNLERKKSFAESLICFPCCFKKETPLAPVSSYLIWSCRFLNIRILAFFKIIFKTLKVCGFPNFKFYLYNNVHDKRQWRPHDILSHFFPQTPVDITHKIKFFISHTVFFYAVDVNWLTYQYWSLKSAVKIAITRWKKLLL